MTEPHEHDLPDEPEPALAPDEAEAAEEEEAEPEAEPEGAPEPEPEPEPNLRSEKDLERAYREIGKLRETVASKLGRIMGDDATALVPCPGCSHFAPGFIFPPEVASLPPEAVAGMKALLGIKDLAEYRQAPDAQPCPDCGALGAVLTGSHVPNYETKTCSRCVGKGYTGTGHVVQPENAATNGTETSGVTGPTVYPPETALPPELQAYKDRGWAIIAPLQERV